MTESIEEIDKKIESVKRKIKTNNDILKNAREDKDFYADWEFLEIKENNNDRLYRKLEELEKKEKGNEI